MNTLARFIFKTFVRPWETFFVRPWAIFPLQPIMVTFTFLATAYIIVKGLDPVTVVDGDIQPLLPSGPAWTYPVWLGMSIGCPMILWLAWYLIFFKHGQARYFGILLRVGGDIGVLLVLIAITISVLGGTVNADGVYFFSLRCAIIFLQAVIVARDIWTLVYIARVADELDALAKEDRGGCDS